MVPSLGSTTVCESSPNLIYPYGLGAVVDPNLLGLGYPYNPYSIGMPAPSTTTLIETAPPAGNLGYMTGLSSMVGRGSFGVPGYGYGVPSLGATTVCDTTPNMVSVGYPYAGLGLSGVAPVSSSTVCETNAPSLLGLGFNLPYGRPFL